MKAWRGKKWKSYQCLTRDKKKTAGFLSFFSRLQQQEKSLTFFNAGASILAYFSRRWNYFFRTTKKMTSRYVQAYVSIFFSLHSPLGCQHYFFSTFLRPLWEEKNELNSCTIAANENWSENWCVFQQTGAPY